LHTNLQIAKRIKTLLNIRAAQHIITRLSVSGYLLGLPTSPQPALAQNIIPGQSSSGFHPPNDAQNSILTWPQPLAAKENLPQLW
jgi:hypothetical protein